jgi:holin-like protein
LDVFKFQYAGMGVGEFCRLYRRYVVAIIETTVGMSFLRKFPLIGFIALVAFAWLGDVLKSALHLPLPGAVIGMLALLLALMIYGSVPDALARASQPLLSHMSLLFIPPGVGLFFLDQQIVQQWPAIVCALVISTAITLALVGILMQRLFAKSR